MADPDDVIPAWGERPVPSGRGVASPPRIFGLDPAKVIALALAALRPYSVRTPLPRHPDDIQAEAERWVRWLRDR